MPTAQAANFPNIKATRARIGPSGDIEKGLSPDRSSAAIRLALLAVQPNSEAPPQSQVTSHPPVSTSITGVDP
jgi:hypothetical protein